MTEMTPSAARQPEHTSVLLLILSGPSLSD